jgi:hypothetical protein
MLNRLTIDGTILANWRLSNPILFERPYVFYKSDPFN